MCSIDGCGKRAKSRSWCGMHYYRWAKYGSTELPRSEYGACEGMKKCRKCAQTLSVQFFTPSQKAADGLASWCRSCHSVISLKYRNTVGLQRKYGITAEEYADMVARQNGVCCICGKPPQGKYTRLSVDHCHKTGRVRGLLCNRCNRAIGLFEDDPRLITVAAAYLSNDVLVGG